MFKYLRNDTRRLGINDIFVNKKHPKWQVKVVYFTNIEVCTEDLLIDDTHRSKLLHLWSVAKFFNEFGFYSSDKHTN